MEESEANPSVWNERDPIGTENAFHHQGYLNSYRDDGEDYSLSYHTSDDGEPLINNLKKEVVDPCNFFEQEASDNSIESVPKPFLRDKTLPKGESLERTSSSQENLVCNSDIIVIPENIATSHLQTYVPETRIYCSRYWILFLFGFINLFIFVQWNAWGPISDSMKAAFPDWSDATIAFLENWSMLIYIVCVAPVCWATGRVGLRVGMLISSGMISVGLALRCITHESPVFTILCHACAVLTGLAGTLLMAAPTMIAAEWFPQNERTSATAIIMAMEPLGIVGSYLEPVLVREPGEGVQTSSIKKDIMNLMYLYAILGGAILLAVLVYFPSKPPVPPSLSSTVERLAFKDAIHAMFRNSNLVALIIIYGIGVGPSISWLGVLNFSIEPLGFSQDDSMYIGLSTVLACTVTTVLGGLLTDYSYGYLKQSLIVLLLSSSFFYYWFLLISYGTIPVVKWQVYLSVGGGLALSHASIPLFFDLASEMAYPVPEVMVGGLITASDCIISTVFLFMFFVKNIGVLWVTQVLVASTALPALCLVFIKGSYARTSYDNERGA